MKKMVAVILALMLVVSAAGCNESTYSKTNPPVESDVSSNLEQSSEPAASSKSPTEQVQEYCNIKNGENVPTKVYEIFVNSSIVTPTENVKYFPNKSNPSKAVDCSFSIGEHNFVAKGYVRKTDEISMSDDADSDLNGYEYTLNSIQSADGKKIYWTELGLEDKVNADLAEDCSDLIPSASKAELLK